MKHAIEEGEPFAGSDLLRPLLRLRNRTGYRPRAPSDELLIAQISSAGAESKDKKLMGT
jgi:hypothetical protein